MSSNAKTFIPESTNPLAIIICIQNYELCTSFTKNIWEVILDAASTVILVIWRKWLQNGSECCFS